MFANFWVQKNNSATHPDPPLHRWWTGHNGNSEWGYSEDNGANWVGMDYTEYASASYVAADCSYGLVSGISWTVYGGAATKAGFNAAVGGWPEVIGTACRKIMKHSDGKLYAAGGDGLYYSTDADNTGDSFSKHATIVGTTMNDLAISGDIWLIPNVNGTWVTTDAGANCHLRDSSDGMMSNHHLSACVVGSTLWVGGVNGVAKSTNSGAAWTVYTTSEGLCANRTTGLAYDSVNGRLWAASYDATNGGLSYTDDNGANWNHIHLSNSKLLNGISFIDHRLYVWAEVSSGNALAYSDDHGANWTYAASIGTNVVHLFVSARS
jgi:hypothetical protein